MDKQLILSDYKKQEDRLCLAHLIDKINLSKTNNKIEYTEFLDMYQVSLVENFLKKVKLSNYKLYGGYEEAERKIAIIYPEKYDDNMLEKNFSKIFEIVKITLGDDEKGKYSHRNYLGGIVKLGIKREKVGDILVSNSGAQIITFKDFSKVLQDQLKTLKRFENANFNQIDIKQITVQEASIENVKIIVPSFRMDNIVSDLIRTSRNKTVEIIKQERVFVNGKNEVKPSKLLKIGDKITVRGKGRFVIKQVEGTTRSGRSVLLVEKYT